MKLLITYFCLMLVLGWACSCNGQTFTKVDWAAASAVYATHTADYLSTEQGVREPQRFKEANLPQALVRSHAGLAAYEFGMASLEVYAQYELSRHGHRTLARIAQSMNVSFTAGVVAHNYELDWHTPRLIWGNK